MGTMRHIAPTSAAALVQRLARSLAVGGPATLALALCLPAPAADTVPADRRSLEELLAEERAAAEAQVEALRPRVETLLSSLSGLGGAKVGDPRVRKIVDELAGLGSPGAVLLVGSLDPERATREALFVAGHVTAALERMPTAAITRELLDLAQGGSARARSSAVRVLGATGDPRRVGPTLARLYREDEGLRSAALAALCVLGGPDADGVLGGLLGGTEDPEQLGLALAALTGAIQEGRQPTATQRAFLDGLLESAAARGLVTELVAHGRALAATGEGAVGEGTGSRYVALAADRLVDRADRVRLLRALPDLGLDWDRKLDALLEPQTKSAFDDLREATLVCLTLYGDKGARRDLLDPFDDGVKADKREPAPLEARGAMLLRIHDFGAAIADYKKAIKMYGDQNRSPYASNQARIGLAKAHVLAGDLRSASKTLEESALSTVQLRNLANDPDFAALVASDRYRGVLRLRD